MKLDDGVAVALAGSYAKHLHIIIMAALCTLCSKKNWTTKLMVVT